MVAAAPQQRVAFQLHPRQVTAMDAIWVDGVDQLLYGGAAGGGKALAVETPIPTPSGWREIGALVAGDEVFDEHGRIVRVAHAFDPFLAESYRLTFDDGTTIDACADHKWHTFTAKELAALTRRDPEWRARRRASRPSRATGIRGERATQALITRNRLNPPTSLLAPAGGVRTTREIVATLRTASGRTNHAIPVAGALDLPEAELPLDPYLLGVWLGDGNTGAGRITTMDAEIEAAFTAAGFPFSPRRETRGRAWSATAFGLVTVLRSLGVLGNKHVPPSYRRASRDQRLALLQGLMDTDGTVTDSGKPEFTNTNKAIVDGVYELIVSLGWKARVVEGVAKLDGRYIGPKWDIKWSPDDYVFRLDRKRSRQALATRRTTKYRYIVDAQPIEPVMMRCISVDGARHLYLAGRSMVPTHNSEFDRAVAYTCAQAFPGGRIAIFRDNFTQLQKTQVAEWRKKMLALGYDIDKNWSASNAEWHFKNPPDPRTGAPVPDTIVEFLHIDQTIGADKWLSSEWCTLIVDEATQLKEHDLRTLYSRVRANEEQRDYWTYLANERERLAREAGVTDEADIKRARCDWRPLAVYTTNPGGVSHVYFLDEFVTPGRDEHFGDAWTITEEVEVNGETLTVNLRRKFVPAFLADNPSLDKKTYVAGLSQLSSARREQLLRGDWDYFEGKVFGMLDPEVHLIDARWPFGGHVTPPRHWPRLGGLDHGTQSPTAALWNTRDEDGFLITYMEYYSPGAVGTHIRSIRELMSVDGALEMVFEADPRMWHASRGRGDRQWSVASEYEFGGEPPQSRGEIEQARRGGIRLHQFKGERIPGRMALERLLEPRPDVMFPSWHPKAGEFGAPLLFIAKQCPNTWRELNGIQYEGEGSEETLKLHDHAYDALYRSAPELERQLTFMAARRRQPRQVQATSQMRRAG